VSSPRPYLLAEVQDHLEQYVREYYFEEEDQGSSPAEAAAATATAFLAALRDVAGDDLAQAAILLTMQHTPQPPPARSPARSA
jgi:hypothetical protein